MAIEKLNVLLDIYREWILAWEATLLKCFLPLLIIGLHCKRKEFFPLEKTPSTYISLSGKKCVQANYSMRLQTACTIENR